ncbi:putative S-adenosylmethionine-dependent methyltransferase of the seven beta-strand family [Durotheca rogersii]|uniref:putative S-adenosylmethionine-dependent methyltransferase of the seven beta-strand family n=1 Tax=Durotheca rogersii TaxID=419775 RepID=UPI002220440E|nr:putative S-adenosylmethionine-dependent methyltransferase of the seven beta-strand family [Durotheca rogersii]KAI5859353.1 putative S-adenosylmethionine-dependent methyltransferase of the seven beta-strand family [Durotheca rogersii]
MSSSQSKPAHLEPSELGTKEYWDNLYAAELSNHAHNPADTGTVWFDDSDAEAKLTAFLASISSSPSSPSSSSSAAPSDDGDEPLPRPALSPPLEKNTTAFLDLGTGNGSLLFRLRDAGWRGPMLGVDYSRASVEFARRISLSRASSSSAAAASITFLEHDVLRASPSGLLAGSQQPDGWDVVLDKGTFDAVSLSAETTSASPSRSVATGRRVAETYRSRVLPLVRAGGLFLVTSCNWTEDELRRWFEGDDEDDQDVGGTVESQAGGGGEERAIPRRHWRFECVGRVEYPSFSFSGIKGQTISSLCFKKVVT